MNEAILKCPNCGTELVFVGTRQVEARQKSKAQMKLDALKAAGISTDNYIAIGAFSANGVDLSAIVRMSAENRPEIVPDDDPVFNAIGMDGIVKNNTLFRRWITAQLLHILVRASETRKDISEILQLKGYEYQFKMIHDELAFQARTEHRDTENFKMRNRWFNKNVLVGILNADAGVMTDAIDNAKVRGKKEVKYLKGIGRVKSSDVEKKVISPLRKALISVRKARNAAELYEAYSRYCEKRVHIPYSTPLSEKFKNAYFGAGAFFAMRNLIMFHGCVLNGCRDMNGSLEALEQFASVYSGEKPGREFVAVLERMLADNNINIVDKLNEWRK